MITGCGRQATYFGEMVLMVPKYVEESLHLYTYRLLRKFNLYIFSKLIYKLEKNGISATTILAVR